MIREESSLLGLVHSEFIQLAKNHADLLAINCRGRKLTYGETEKYSLDLSEKLLRVGCRAGDIVVIHGKRNMDLVVSLLAVARIGAVFFVLNDNYPDDYLVKLTKPIKSFFWLNIDLLGRDISELRKIFGHKLKAYLRCSSTDNGCCDVDVWREPQRTTTAFSASTHPLYVATTSGSTGFPKLVQGSHHPIVHFVKWYKQKFQLDSRDRFSLLSGIGHDPMLRDIFVPLSIGASIFIPSESDLESKQKIEKWVYDNKVSVVHTTPMLSEWLFNNAAGTQYPDLRLVASGGGVLTYRDANSIFLVARNSRVVNFYGTTETPQAFGYFEVDRNEVELTNNGSRGASSIPIGKPIDDVEITIFDKEATPCQVNKEGEICVSTKYLSDGYYSDGSTLLDTIEGGTGKKYYRTGDYGFLDEKGEIHFVGRKDRRINHRNYRIQLEEIEHAVKELPYIQNVAVVEESNELGHSCLTCFLQFKHGQNHIEKKIRECLVKKIPPFMLPEKLVTVEKIPLNGNGKIDYSQLGSSLYEVSKHKISVVSNKVVKSKVSKILSRLLAVNEIDIREDKCFFELGGNSIVAVEFCNQLNEIFTTKVSVTDIFLYPSIDNLSNFLMENQSSSEQSRQTIQTDMRRRRALEAIQSKRKERIYE